MHRIAVIRVRGKANVNKEIKKTLEMLRLKAQNHCVIIKDTPAYLGMLQKAKDYITWGSITKEDVSLLLRERGELDLSKIKIKSEEELKLLKSRKITDDYLKKYTKFPSIDEFAEAFVNFKAELSDIPGLKPVFRLHPPKKGWKSIKKHFKLGGALGNRGEKMSELLRRMT